VVKKSSALPDRGDLVWLDFSPQAGKEQAGRRPGYVISRAIYTAKSGLVIVCPITNQAKGYPFEVPLPSGAGVSGVILVDHLRSADWSARNGKRIASAPASVWQAVSAKLSALTS
jgi:mRNA interferase MazF